MAWFNIWTVQHLLTFTNKSCVLLCTYRISLVISFNNSNLLDVKLYLSHSLFTKCDVFIYHMWSRSIFKCLLIDIACHLLPWWRNDSRFLHTQNVTTVILLFILFTVLQPYTGIHMWCYVTIVFILQFYFTNYQCYQ